MKEIKTTIVINGTVEKVWKTLTTFEDYPAWNPFILEIKGKAELNANLQTRMLNSGKERRFTPVITQFEESRYFEWLGKLPLGLFNGRHYFQIERLDDEQTKLIHGEYFTGLLATWIMNKIGADTERGFKAMNQALKRRVES